MSRIIGLGVEGHCLFLIAATMSLDLERAAEGVIGKPLNLASADGMAARNLDVSARKL